MTYGDIELGNCVILWSLAIQAFFSGLFVGVVVIFHYCISCEPTAQSISLKFFWQRHLVVLYVASGLIFGRFVFRYVECAGERYTCTSLMRPQCSWLWSCLTFGTRADSV